MEPAGVVRVRPVGGQCVCLKLGEIGWDADGEVQHEVVYMGKRFAGNVRQGCHLEGDCTLLSDVVMYGDDMVSVKKGKAAGG